MLEGVLSVASVHLNLACVQPQTVAARGILQEVVLWGSVEGSTFVRYQSAELIVDTLSPFMAAHGQ